MALAARILSQFSARRSTSGARPSCVQVARRRNCARYFRSSWRVGSSKTLRPVGVVPAFVFESPDEKPLKIRAAGRVCSVR